jgi:hypothetical protein
MPRGHPRVIASEIDVRVVAESVFHELVEQHEILRIEIDPAGSRR